MNLFTALKSFSEKYNREAISSINSFCERIDVINSPFKFEAVDIPRAFRMFGEYIEGYVSYKCEHPSEGIEKNNQILNQTKSFIESGTDKEETNLFQSVQIKYTEARDFIKNYISDIGNLVSHVNEYTNILYEAGVTNEDIGLLTEMCDEFINAIQPHIEAVMNHMLGATGYNYKLLQEASKHKKVESKPIFI